MPCMICTMHKKTSSVSFFVKPQNQGRRVSRFGLQNQQLRFGDLSLKITVAVSWFESQNQACGGLSVVSQNQLEEDGVGHASRFNGLLRLKASQTRVF
jgi:hypothetical protein